MAGADANKYRIEIGDGLVASTQTYIEVPCQGEGTFNSGRALESAQFKSGNKPYRTQGGATFTFTMGMEVPANASQELVFISADNGTTLAWRLTHADTGAQIYTGNARCVITELSVPVEGIATYQVQVAWEGQPARTQQT